MIFETCRKSYKSEIISSLKADKKYSREAEDMLVWLEEYSTYYICTYDPPETTLTQRMNRLWVVPLYLTLVAPFRWVIYGKIGVHPQSKAGIILYYLVGGL